MADDEAHEGVSQGGDACALERALLWTCVHEAGHAVIATEEGYDVVHVTIHGPGHGTTAGVNEKNVNVAVAGYAAVGAVLGPEARMANVAYDTHLEPDSDVMIAIGAAKDEGCVEEDDIWEYIEDADARVAVRMTGDTLAAVAEIGLYLAGMSGLRMLSGDALRREICQPSAAESDAQEQLRTWWDALN